jgi:hypothetical protein
MVELLTEYRDIFATKSNHYRPTDRVNHHIGMREALPMHQPRRRLLLAKQADVGKMLENMQRHGVIKESERPSPSPIILFRK